MYIESVPEDESGNYIQLRVESETEVDRNDKTWIKDVVMIIEIVTTFEQMVNPDVANGIDDEVGTLLFTSPASGHNLAAQTGMKINSITLDTSTNIQEDDGVRKYYRKITRYNNLITIQI